MQYRLRGMLSSLVVKFCAKFLTTQVIRRYYLDLVRPEKVHSKWFIRSWCFRAGRS